MSRRELALVLGFALAISAAAAADGFEERLDRASGLLAEEPSWPEAIELFRGLLEESPHRDDIRVRLARVLAWRGEYDASLAEYARVLDAEPAAQETLVERAEVLSWAGRTEEAQTAFEDLLAEDPGNARAARGLARAYRWAGRASAADRAYRVALALEDDAEARQEWQALRASFPPELELRSAVHADEEGYTLYESWLEASVHPDLDTRLHARTGWLRLSLDDFTDRAYDTGVGAQRWLSERVRASLELGGRRWGRAKTRVYARGSLDLKLRPQLGLTFGLSREDHLDHAGGGRESVRGRVRGTYGRMSLSWQPESSTDVFAQVQTGRIAGGNQLYSFYGEVARRPWDNPLRVGLSASVSGYTEPDERYYTPDLEAGAAIFASHRLVFGSSFAFESEASVGYGHSKEAELAQSGPSFATRLALEWFPSAWVFRIEVQGSRSQRASTYQAGSVAFVLRRAF